MKKMLVDTFPIVEMVGRKFHAIPKDRFRDVVLDGKVLKDEDPALLDFHVAQELSEMLIGGDGLVYKPVLIPDESAVKPFPKIERAGRFVRAGLTTHKILPYDDIDPSSEDAPITPNNIEVFSDEDFLQLGMDYYVALEDAGWTFEGDTALSTIEKLKPIYGESVLSLAQERHPAWPDLYVMYLAAFHFAEPFSQLWYVIHLMTMVDGDKGIYHDDLSFGYLWCEYQFKKKYEWPAEQQIAQTAKNRENGQKGGQAEKKAARYKVLNLLALEKQNDFAFSGDKEAIRKAKHLAAKYDKDNETGLFAEKNKHLSNEWYSDWLGQFRNSMRKTA